RSLERRAAVARVALGHGPGGGGEFMRLQVQAPHAVIADLAKVERAIWPDDEPVWIVGLAGSARSAVTRKSSNAVSSDRRDGLGGGHQHKGEKKDEFTHRARSIM